MSNPLRVLVIGIALIGLTSPVHSIVGDLNKDGIVDFADFFLLAENFGKEGPPELPDTVEVVVRDTVVIVQIDTVEIPPDTVEVVVHDTVVIVQIDTVAPPPTPTPIPIVFTGTEIGTGSQLTPKFVLEEGLYAVTLEVGGDVDEYEAIVFLESVSLTGASHGIDLIGFQSIPSVTGTWRIRESDEFIFEINSPITTWTITIIPL